MASTGLMNTEIKFEVAEQEVKLTGNIVKSYLTRGNKALTEQEIVMFMNLCKYRKLNPFVNEAYAVKFGDQPAQFIVGKEAFMKRAESDPSYDGHEAGIIVERNGEIVELEGTFKLQKDILLGAWAKVYIKNKKCPMKATVSLQEYSKGQSTWKSMPCTMIRKVALVQALREAFPSDLGAMYTSEEVGEAYTNTVKEPTPVKEKIEFNPEKEEPKQEVEPIEAEIVEEELDENEPDF